MKKTLVILSSLFVIALLIFFSFSSENVLANDIELREISGKCTGYKQWNWFNKIEFTGCDESDIQKKCNGSIKNIVYTCKNLDNLDNKTGTGFTPKDACSVSKTGSPSILNTYNFSLNYIAECHIATTNYVLNIDRDGGNLGSSDFKYSSDAGIGSYTFNRKTTHISVTVNFPTTGTKTGYEFGGIYTEKNCKGKKISSPLTVTAKDNYSNYYACWNPKTPVNNSGSKTPTIQNQTPIKEVPVQNKIQTEINNNRYVGNFTRTNFEGSLLSCGDKVFITTCDESMGPEATCKVDAINGIKVSGTKVYRQSLMESIPTCPAIKRYTQSGMNYFTDSSKIGKNNDKKTMDCGEEVTFIKTPSEACRFGPHMSTATEGIAMQYCEVEYKGSTVYVDRTKLSYGEPVCFEEKEEEETPDEKPDASKPSSVASVCKTSKQLKDQKSYVEKKMSICYTYDNKKLTADSYDEKNIFTCAKGYRRIQKIDKENSSCDQLTNSKEKQTCYKTYNYSCQSIAKPRIHGRSAIATPDEIGTISITGYDSTTENGLKGYLINDGEMPTINSNWKSYPNTEYKDTITKTVGTYFAWTITNDASISYPIMLRIHSDNVTTTAQNIELKDSDTGNNLPFTAIKPNDDTLGYEDGILSNNYVRLSNQLLNDSIVATGFDLFNTAYELTVESNKIAIYATLTSSDSNYVEGYEPRTVSLDYGRNIVQIKIVNSSGRERAYTFVITRVDNRESVNTLKTLTTSLGNINFDPYISDYTISVPKNSKSVSINGTLDSLKSAFIKGYEPRTIDLNNNITSAVLKTISEAGITRNYVLTFIKTGTEISDDITSSALLSSLTMPGVEINFDRDILSYTVAVPYEVEDLPIYALPESNNATIEINGNQGLKVGANKVEIIVTNNLVVKIYNIFINRKEDGLEVSSNTKLETLSVKDYDINFYEDVYDYKLKIKREKTLLLTATPQSNRSEVYMYGNNDLTAFSTIRVKVIAENGETGLYSIDIVKDLYNKDLEITVAIVGGIILLGSSIIIVINKRRKKMKDYVES